MVNEEYISQNSLLRLFPSIAEEWDYVKNIGLTPAQVSAHAGKKVWWKCKNNHSYEAKVCNRTATKGTSCPYCQNRKVLEGFNDLATISPEIALEWDYEANTPYTPQMFMNHSNKKVAWICGQGHRYTAMINNRTKNGTGCPYCSGRLSVEGTSDLLSQYPDVAKEWDYEKNYPMQPQMVSAHSNRKYWWKCELSHSYDATASNRVYGSGCPYCSSKKVLVGFNDLASRFPDIAKEWCTSRNGFLKPDMITSASNKQVWWRCPLGHEYSASVNKRTGEFTACPTCAKETQTSFSEQVIFFYIKKQYPDAINRYKVENHEVDIFIPRENTGIEYDGFFYHTPATRERDQRKTDFFSRRGIRLIRIKEYDENGEIPSASENTIFVERKHPNFEYAINEVLSVLGIDKVSVDLSRDRSTIIEQYYSSIKSNSISQSAPWLLPEWDYEKNGNLTPEIVPKGANHKVWWRCSLGHSYAATPNHRTSSQTGCPICANQKVLSGFNDLETRYPSIARSWDFDKNGNLRPNEVLPRSHKKVWWKCSCGRSYLQALSYRTSDGCSGKCQFCAQQH